MIIATLSIILIFINKHMYLVVAEKLCVYIFLAMISVCACPYLLSLFSPYFYIIISGNMMIQLNM